MIIVLKRKKSKEVLKEVFVHQDGSSHKYVFLALVESSWVFKFSMPQYSIPNQIQVLLLILDNSH